MQTKLTKIIITTAMAAVLLSAVYLSMPSSQMDVNAVVPQNEATITGEITSKRDRFVKQFSLSDGSYLAVTYSIPVHFKEGNTWKEINTTLAKVKNKTIYRTQATNLQITVAPKADQKAMIAFKRGTTAFSWGIQDKKLKAAKVTIKNPKKAKETEILNENQVQYKSILKNTDVTYDIYPEKVMERIVIKKKTKHQALTFHVNSGKLTPKIKKGRVYFENKKGETPYIRFSTILTDANGVSTGNSKIQYNKKTKTLTITPNKKWWNSKKRKFPITIRTTYATDQHGREVKIGAAYAGAPSSTYGYHESLLSQAGKCVLFTQMPELSELGSENVQIRNASLYIQTEEALTLGAGKTFDLGLHKVTKKWNGSTLTYNNRPSYETIPVAKFSLQKKKEYESDITTLVQDWYKGVPNYGVALVADNSNGAYQAKLGRHPYFAIRYEIVGFDGAAELKEGATITREILKAGQENDYYFDPEPGIAYEVYTTSDIDTQGILYDSDKNRLSYDDNSGLGNNFAFVRSDDGRRYLRISTKGTKTGTYTLTLKKRFTIPEPSGKKNPDSYQLSWNAIPNAAEYLVTIYDGKEVIGTAVATDTNYEYIYTNATRGKILAFTVTARESKELTGEPSRRIYTGEASSLWHYDTPMPVGKIDFASSVLDGKIYVLGGGTQDGTKQDKKMVVYDPKKETWQKVADYPGDVDSIRQATMLTINGEIYVFGGQTDTTAQAQILSSVYAYNPQHNTWKEKAYMPTPRTHFIGAVHGGKIYNFARIGSTERVDVYNIATDTWQGSTIQADTSTTLQVQAIDNRLFVLKEKGNNILFQEYLPEQESYGEEGSVCPFANADHYTKGTVINGKIYMVKEGETSQAICYDAYQDTWSQVSRFNMDKEGSHIQAIGNTLYSLGGAIGDETLDVMERYDVSTTLVAREISANKGETYELQIDAGNLKEDTDYIVTIKIDPDVLTFNNVTSMMTQEDIENGKEGVKLLRL